jgi:hypothetical protein
VIGVEGGEDGGKEDGLQAGAEVAPHVGPAEELGRPMSAKKATRPKAKAMAQGESV